MGWTDAGRWTSRAGVAVGVVLAGAAAQPARAQVVTGAYAGNGVDGRNVGGLWFSPALVAVKGDATNREGALRSSTMTGDVTKRPTLGTAFVADLIQSIDAGGFSLGTNDSVNAGGIAYVWAALAPRAGEIAAGSYTGDGTDDRNLAGLGFSPDYVLILPANSGVATQRSSTMSGDASAEFQVALLTPNRIQGFGADGFQVGSDAAVNTVGIGYHFVALRAQPGRIAVGSYSGDGTDDRNLTTLGFAPEVVLLFTAGDWTWWRPASLGAGDVTCDFHSRLVTNHIQALLPTGFQVGSGVNASGSTYHFVALAREPAPGDGGADGADGGAADADDAQEDGADDGAMDAPTEAAPEPTSDGGAGGADAAGDGTDVGGDSAGEAGDGGDAGGGGAPDVRERDAADDPDGGGQGPDGGGQGDAAADAAWAPRVSLRIGCACRTGAHGGSGPAVTLSMALALTALGRRRRGPSRA